MNNENKLQSAVEGVVKDLYGVEGEGLVTIEIPKNTEYGDYATPVAMQLAGRLKKNPRAIADEMKEALLQEKDLIDTVEVAGPGFINFRLKSDSLGAVISRVFEKGDKYGWNYSGVRKPVLVEYVSANPTGDLHLGHARGAVWGDCICRLYKASNYDVLREYYINDAGAQMINLGKSVYARYAQFFGEDVKVPEDGYFADDVKKIGEDIALEEGDVWLHKEEGRIEHFKQKGYEVELKKIEQVLKDLRVEFDSWVSEQWLYDSGLVEETIQKLKDLGVTYEEDGALWLKTTQWGDDKDRVLVKSDGTLTYMTPDLANHRFKHDRGYTKMINLWGGDHHGYVARMKAGLQTLGFGPDDLEVDLIQMIHLVEDGQEVKMSKRSGNAITIQALIDDVGVDVTRYFFASRAVESQMDFDLALARSHSNENPVYYIQYAHARACGVLRNAPEFKEQTEFTRLNEEKEVDLLKLMDDFPSIVEEAAVLRRPHRICNFLMQMATAFHSFYGSSKVIVPEDPELSNERIGLVMACRQVMENALWLIGISAPESM